MDSFNESIIGGYFVRLTGRSTLSVLCDFDINPKWSLSSRIYSSQFSEKVKTVWINYDTSLSTGHHQNKKSSKLVHIDNPFLVVESHSPAKS